MQTAYIGLVGFHYYAAGVFLSINTLSGFICITPYAFLVAEWQEIKDFLEIE